MEIISETFRNERKSNSIFSHLSVHTNCESQLVNHDLVVGIMHPSPLNPKANKDYIGIVQKDLERLGVLK